VILYWFGPPESKTLHPVFRFVLLRSQVVCGVHLVPGTTPLPALYWATNKVGGPESRSITTGKPISSQLQHGKLIWAALIRLDCLVLHVKSCGRAELGRLGTFWKVFGRSCGPPTKSVGPNNRSAGLLVCRTYLSGTVVSLVGGDPGVPMSHRNGFLMVKPCLLLTQCTSNLELVIGKKPLVSIGLMQHSPLVKLGERKRK
jgi:hypothetical protein